MLNVVMLSGGCGATAQRPFAPNPSTRPVPSRQVYVDQLAEQLSYRQVLKKACESIELATSDANAKVNAKVKAGQQLVCFEPVFLSRCCCAAHYPPIPLFFSSFFFYLVYSTDMEWQLIPSIYPDVVSCRFV